MRNLFEFTRSSWVRYSEYVQIALDAIDISQMEMGKKSKTVMMTLTMADKLMAVNMSFQL